MIRLLRWWIDGGRRSLRKLLRREPRGRRRRRRRRRRKRAAGRWNYVTSNPVPANVTSIVAGCSVQPISRLSRQLLRLSQSFYWLRNVVNYRAAFISNGRWVQTELEVSARAFPCKPGRNNCSGRKWQLALSWRRQSVSNWCDVDSFISIAAGVSSASIHLYPRWRWIQVVINSVCRVNWWRLTEFKPSLNHSRLVLILTSDGQQDPSPSSANPLENPSIGMDQLVKFPWNFPHCPVEIKRGLPQFQLTFFFVSSLVIALFGRKGWRFSRALQFIRDQRQSSPSSSDWSRILRLSAGIRCGTSGHSATPTSFDWPSTFIGGVGTRHHGGPWLDLGNLFSENASRKSSDWIRPAPLFWCDQKPRGGGRNQACVIGVIQSCIQSCRCGHFGLIPFVLHRMSCRCYAGLLA